jgi:hypothetical protein
MAAEENAQEGPRIGEWFAEALALFGRQWPVWCAQGAVAFAAVAPFFAGSVAHFFFVFIRELNAANTGFETDPTVGQRAITQALWIVVLALIPIALLSTYFAAGMSRTAARQRRGEPIGIGDLFSGGRVFLPALGAALLVTLCSSLLILFLLVPAVMIAQGRPVGPAVAAGAALLLLVPLGLFLTARLMLVHPMVTEGELGLVHAVRESWRRTGRHQGGYLAWALLVYLTAGAGLLFVVGTIVSLPLAMLMLAVSYRGGPTGGDDPQITQITQITEAAHE